VRFSTVWDRPGFEFIYAEGRENLFVQRAKTKVKMERPDQPAKRYEVRTGLYLACWE
jgi:hypothetical protein